MNQTGVLMKLREPESKFNEFKAKYDALLKDKEDIEKKLKEKESQFLQVQRDYLKLKEDYNKIILEKKELESQKVSSYGDKNVNLI